MQRAEKLVHAPPAEAVGERPARRRGRGEADRAAGQCDVVRDRADEVPTEPGATPDRDALCSVAVVAHPRALDVAHGPAGPAEEREVDAWRRPGIAEADIERRHRRAARHLPGSEVQQHDPITRVCGRLLSYTAFSRSTCP